MLDTDKAKITENAIRMLSTGQPYSRRDLFWTKRLDKRPITHWPKWDLKVLDRLIDLGILEATGTFGTRKYQAKDAIKLQKILKDPEGISKLIWDHAQNLLIPETVLAPASAASPTNVTEPPMPEIAPAVSSPPEQTSEPTEIDLEIESLAKQWAKTFEIGKIISPQKLIELCKENSILEDYIRTSSKGINVAKRLSRLLVQYKGKTLGGNYTLAPDPSRRGWMLEKVGPSDVPEKATPLDSTGIAEKVCTTCSHSKPLTDFNLQTADSITRTGKSLDGYGNTCKQCSKEHVERRRNNKRETEPETKQDVVEAESRQLEFPSPPNPQGDLSEILRFQEQTYSLLEKIVDAIVNVRVSIETVYNRVKKLEPNGVSKASVDNQRVVDKCSFCGKQKGDNGVKNVLPGPGVGICNECVQLCSGILKLD